MFCSFLYKVPLNSRGVAESKPSRFIYEYLGATGCSVTQVTTQQGQWPANSGSKIVDVMGTAEPEGRLQIQSVSLATQPHAEKVLETNEVGSETLNQHFRLVFGSTVYESRSLYRLY
jgi:hypothetical protein